MKIKEDHEKELQTLEVSNIILSLNQLSCTLHVMLFVVTACAGENKRKSRERAANIGGKQYHSFIESVELCPGMLFVVTVRAGENERRSRERTADIGGKQSFVISFFH